ncbi:MAG: MFS transporter [Chloroflexota bacterium]|nr:MFS transporter [Chloroflexota bacterium]
MFNFLKPSPTLSERDVQRTLLRMRWDAVTGGAMFSIGGGGFMAAYALALGASNLQVGILAALPPVSQVIQLPAILLSEKFRARKAIAVPAWFLAQFMWLLIGCVPFLLNTPGAAAVTAIIFLLAVRGLFTSVYNTSVTSWVRDLVPQSLLGRYYSRRFGMMTVSIAVAGLGGSFFVYWWQSAASPANDIYAYSLLLVGGWAVFGFVGPLLVAGAREPLMPAAQEDGRSTVSILLEPLQDRNFSRLIRFLVMWNFALNMAVPFFAVYMLTRLGFSLPIVIGFTIVSQVTNVLFIRVWGAMADRTGSKTVLSLAASLYLLVIFGWMFTTNPDQYILTIPLLAVLHVFAGIAAAGVQLTIQTLALKSAPGGRATPYLGIAGMATGLGAGTGPIVGGALADFFSVRVFRIDLSWSTPSGVFELPSLTLAGFDFLFPIAFILGLLSLNLLAVLREEGDLGRETALNELMAGMAPMMRPVSSVPAVGAISAASYGYIRRVPGADVALGVMAYQLASSTQMAVTSAERGISLAQRVQLRVGSVLEDTIDRMEGVGEYGLELAQHATRGALHAGQEMGEQADRVAHAAATGAIRTLSRLSVQAHDSL